MTPKYFQAEAPQRDRWMISYVDVLTILLIFFIAIAAHSFPALQATPAPKTAPPEPAIVEPPPPDAANNVMHQLQQKLAQQGLQVQLEPRGLVISLPQAVLFASGDDQVSRDAHPLIAKIADVLREVPNQISLIGHADSVPIHNRRFKNNWELSAARGLRLLEMLSGSDYGIPESRLSVMSDGSFRPKDSNDTPDGRASNRRVEIVILNESGVGAR